MSNITIIDAPCGYGKTSWAIEYMNDNEFERFIYITPYLDEVSRIKNDVDRTFKEPNVKRGKGSKRNDFYNLLTNGEDIATTHSLFKGVDKNVKDEIKEKEYILILDEVMDVVEQINISKDDINILIERNIIKVNEEGKVYWIDDKYRGEFIKYKKSISNGDVYLHNGAMILWTFPCDIFNSFKEVYILTYMFKGQIQAYYYDLNKLKYEYKSVENIDNKYKLTSYKKINGEKYKDLITIYNGKLNEVGKGNSLTKSWYTQASKKVAMRKLKDCTYNYFNNIINDKSDYNMWTTFKDYKNECKGNRYTKGFVECNVRATNEYKHKTNLAYLINRYYNPMIEQFFTQRKVSIDRDTYALSELIQWMFRSAIRENKPINIYIPSERMRRLLQEWLGINQQD